MNDIDEATHLWANILTLGAAVATFVTVFVGVRRLTGKRARLAGALVAVAVGAVLASVVAFVVALFAGLLRFGSA